jgi:hypothetical protein
MKKIKTEKDNYKKIPINSLIVFGLYSRAKEKKCSFEDLAIECFDLFPDNFCLNQYPQYPDSRKLDRPIRDLRRKGLIKGDSRSGIYLSVKGINRALQIERNFSQIKLKI